MSRLRAGEGMGMRRGPRGDLSSLLVARFFQQCAIDLQPRRRLSTYSVEFLGFSRCMILACRRDIEAGGSAGLFVRHSTEPAIPVA